MPAKPDPPVTVSIVSHGQWALIEPLLEQLDEWCSSAIAKVVLTVNIRETLPPTRTWRFAIERIDNVRPKGFGANHNAAFARCHTPWFLILNPDIRLDSDVLSALLLRTTRDAGLVSPRIAEPGKRAAEPYRGLLTPLELIRRRWRDHRPPAAPVWVAGMFMLIRREAFEQIRGFDPRFFMYCEDFDLCARLRLAGWTLRVEPSVTVLHLAQRASQTSIRPLLWHLTSLVKVWTSSAFWRYRDLLRHAQANP